MPTYQYECSVCGHSFEIVQSMADKRLLKCPKCKKNKLIRLIGSGSGIIFKGSGFYETDYKRKAPAADKPSKAKTPTCCPDSCSCPAKEAAQKKNAGGS